VVILSNKGCEVKSREEIMGIIEEKEEKVKRLSYVIDVEKEVIKSMREVIGKM